MSNWLESLRLIYFSLSSLRKVHLLLNTAATTRILPTLLLHLVTSEHNVMPDQCTRIHLVKNTFLFYLFRVLSKVLTIVQMHQYSSNSSLVLFSFHINQKRSQKDHGLNNSNLCEDKPLFLKIFKAL